MSDKIRVGVLFGGRSGEREVSLASGRQIYLSLDQSRYRGVPVFMDLAGHLWHVPDKLVVQNTCKDVDARLEADAAPMALEELADAVDIVFITLHGKYGDDGCIQGALELMDVAYTGSGVLACAASLDKPVAHRLLAAQGFDVPQAAEVHEDDYRADPDGWLQRLVDCPGLPAVVLPAREGSSLGVSVVETADELPAALAAAFEWDARVLVEERLTGLEFSVIVTGNAEPSAFLPTEVVTSSPFMTYEDKYMPGRSQKITPARVSPQTTERIQTGAIGVYRALGFAGYARLDGFLTADDRLVFNDPNSTSGMAPSSFTFHQAAEAGLGPTELVTRLIELGLEAHSGKKGPL